MHHLEVESPPDTPNIIQRIIRKLSYQPLTPIELEEPQIAPINKLSDDILYKIFTYLPLTRVPRSFDKTPKYKTRLSEMALVCRRWKQIVENNHIFAKCDFFANELGFRVWNHRTDFWIFQNSKRQIESALMKFNQKSLDWSDDFILRFWSFNQGSLRKLTLKFDPSNSSKRLQKIHSMLEILIDLEYLCITLTFPEINERLWSNSEVNLEKLRYLIIEPRTYLKNEVSFRYLEYLNCPNIETLKISLDCLDQSQQISPGVFSSDPEKFNIIGESLYNNGEFLKNFITKNGGNLKKILIPLLFEFTNYSNAVTFKASNKNLDLTEVLLRDRFEGIVSLELNSVAYHKFYKFVLKQPTLETLKIQNSLLVQLFGLLKMKQLKSITIEKFQIDPKSVANFYTLARNLETIYLHEPEPKTLVKSSIEFQLFRLFKKLKKLQIKFADGPLFEEVINYTVKPQLKNENVKKKSHKKSDRFSY
jgi:hypothetical protein